MTERLIIQPIPNRLAQPHRSDRLVLGAPIDRKNRAKCPKRRSIPPGKNRPRTETVGFARYRQTKNTASGTNTNTLYP